MLLVFCTLLAVAVGAVLWAVAHDAQVPPRAPGVLPAARPAIAPRPLAAAPAVVRPPAAAGRLHWGASDLPAPGQEPICLRQVYRARGGVDFTFSFERQDSGTWRAFIAGQPGYGPRDASLVVSHRLPDGDRHYVCFKPEPGSMQGVARVAMKWADLTVVYIRTGRTIDAQVAAEQSAR